MNILLDTHALLWMISGDERLSQRAADAILDRQNTLFVSLASHWEVGIKISIGKLRLAHRWEVKLDREMANGGIQSLPIAVRHTRAIIDPPFHHRDPFDRLLIAQAMVEKLTIVTADKHFENYAIPTIW